MASKPFELGLCLAGAVSAGAYTAGVMDYLFEALDAWENKKNKAEKNVPSHQVLLKVIGGASAGGMTGIIASTMVNEIFDPIKHVDQKDLFAQQPGNKLYHSWVDQLQKDMFPMLLDNSDISSQNIPSLLNSGFIDKIADRAIQVKEASQTSRNYIDENLKFFTTLTNLNGLKYSATQQGNLQSNDYYLSQHNDYACFQLQSKKVKTNDSTFPTETNRGWIPVDYLNGLNVKAVKESAMATGAFPVGLKSRYVSRPADYVNKLEWHEAITEHFPVPGPNYSTLNVDGGTINNEPFERVKSLLDGINENEEKFSAASIMIDPFPSAEQADKMIKDDITSSIGATLSAMLGHLRSKPEILDQMYSKAYAGQFQIAPRRSINQKDVEGSKAIACGFLGGFGGFLDKEFRIHDFFLGRANCEWFLRHHFTVPADTKNPIFKDGYEGVNLENYKSSKNGRLPIIPLFTKAANQMYMPTFASGNNWPSKKEKEITRFKPKIKHRVGKIIMNISKYSWSQRILIGIGNRIILRKKISNTIMDSILKSMSSHNLLR